MKKILIFIVIFGLNQTVHAFIRSNLLRRFERALVQQLPIGQFQNLPVQFLNQDINQMEALNTQTEQFIQGSDAFIQSTLENNQKANWFLAGGFISLLAYSVFRFNDLSLAGTVSSAIFGGIVGWKTKSYLLSRQRIRL